MTAQDTHRDAKGTHRDGSSLLVALAALVDGESTTRPVLLKMDTGCYRRIGIACSAGSNRYRAIKPAQTSDNDRYRAIKPPLNGR